MSKLLPRAAWWSRSIRWPALREYERILDSGMSAHDLMRNVECLGPGEKRQIYDIVTAAAVARYVLRGSTPGDVSIDLDRVRAEMPAAYDAVIAVYTTRMAILSTKAS